MIIFQIRHFWKFPNWKIDKFRKKSICKTIKIPKIERSLIFKFEMSANLKLYCSKFYPPSENINFYFVKEICDFLGEKTQIVLKVGMCTDPRHIELFGVRFEIPAFEPVRNCSNSSDSSDSSNSSNSSDSSESSNSSNYSNKLFTFASIDVPRLSPAHPWCVVLICLARFP